VNAEADHLGPSDMSGTDRSQIVELRRYALRPGARETLIELFDRELVETQEAVGMEILGQFRDLDDPDSFVWLRGFPDMERRKEALAAFYGGPVWKRHARAANATMLDSDNVLLVRPVSPLDHDPQRRAAPGTTLSPSGMLAITIWPLVPATAAEVPALFRDLVEPALRDVGVSVLATYVTEQSENTFPALPVRENEEVFVWMSLFEDEADHLQHARALANNPLWREHSRLVAAHLKTAEQTLRLRPTARSALHART
jgi:quinol monooxygenase YgiN